MRGIVKDSRGSFESVTEEQIRAARRLVRTEEGIEICFSAAAAVAGLLKSVQQGTVPASDRIMINLTGSDREESSPHEHTIRLTKRNDGTWKPAA